jgi:uncharacterized protein YwqG
MRSTRKERIVTPNSSGAQPAVRLTPSPSGAGASHLGGAPHVAPGFEWPRRDGVPLGFLGQFDLAAVARFPFAGVLPPRGLLSFFYEADQQPWGFDPKDRGSWLVHFEPDPTTVERRDPPDALPDASRFPEVPVEMSEVETLADDEPDDEEENPAPRHQLLGHPGAIQGDMRLECALVTHGLSTGDGSAYSDPRARALEATAGQWRLLAQIDSDDAAAMMWGDVGRLYFWITEEALTRRAFDECWVILQCS